MPLYDTFSPCSLQRPSKTNTKQIFARHQQSQKKATTPSRPHHLHKTLLGRTQPAQRRSPRSDRLPLSQPPPLCPPQPTREGSHTQSPTVMTRALGKSSRTEPTNTRSSMPSWTTLVQGTEALQDTFQHRRKSPMQISNCFSVSLWTECGLSCAVK